MKSQTFTIPGESFVLIASMLKYLMIFDLNLYELPSYKNYDGFLPELFV
jgi:hypothetical protein